MLRDFIKVSSVYAFQNIIQRGAEFLLLPFYLSVFSTSDYGIISMSILLITGLSSIFSLSLEGAISRYYFKYSEDEELLKKFIGSIITFLLVFLLIISICFLLFSKGFWELIIPKLEFNPYIFLVIIISAVDPINRLFFSLLLIKRDIKRYSLYYNFYFYLKLFSIVFISYYLESPYWYFVSFLSVVTFFIPISLYGLKDYFKWGISIEYLREAISYSLYILPVTMMAIVNSFIDKYIIINNMTLSDVGIYSAGVNLASIILLVATVMNKAYVSFFVEKYEEKLDDFESSISLMSDIYIVVIIISTLFMSLFIHYFEWILPEEYIDSIKIISVFVFVGASNGLYFYYTNFMSLEQKLVKYKVLGFGLGILINFPISYYLTIRIGLIGAAIGTLVGFLISLIIMKCLVVRVGKFSVSNKYIYLLLSTLGLSVFINQMTNNTNVWVGLVVRVFVMIIVVYFIDRYFFTEKNLIFNYFNKLYNYVKNNIIK